MPRASQFAFCSAHIFHSDSVFACQSLIAFSDSPRISPLIEHFICKPLPTIYVRFVLIAAAAIGDAIYNIRPRCRKVLLLKSISSIGDPLFAVNPFSARFTQLAPASLYPLARTGSCFRRNILPNKDLLFIASLRSKVKRTYGSKGASPTSP